MDGFTQYMSAFASTVISVALAVGIGFIINKASTLPPGPSSLRCTHGLLGSREYLWLTFTRWAKQYGSIYSFNIFGMRRIVVLNDIDVFFRVLGAPQFAGRPQFTVAGDLMGFNRVFVRTIHEITLMGFQMTAMLSQGPVLRMHRRLAHLVLNPDAVRDFSSVQERAARHCVLSIREKADAFKELRFASIRSIVELLYGITLQTPDDPFIEKADVAFREVAQALLPGKHIADLIPLLKHIPLWCIGSGFKWRALQVRMKLDAMFDYPFKLATQLIALGNSEPSFVSAAIKRVSQDGKLDGNMEKTISDIAGSLYGAAVDTTFNVLLTVILCACLHPVVQARAQEEIDNVVGRDRLPRLADFSSLPYVQAMVKEAIRLYPISPLGLSRVATEDSVINGFCIPKGSQIIPNIWAITRVSGGSGHPADEFHPERFLSTSPPPDPTTYIFGAGRRSCIGKTVGENFLFTIVPVLLAAYEVRPPLSPSGIEQPLEVKWTNSVTFCPEFKCRFVARNDDLLDRLQHDADV